MGNNEQSKMTATCPFCRDPQLSHRLTQHHQNRADDIVTLRGMFVEIFGVASETALVNLLLPETGINGIGTIQLSKYASEVCVKLARLRDALIPVHKPVCEPHTKFVADIIAKQQAHWSSVHIRNCL